MDRNDDLKKNEKIFMIFILVACIAASILWMLSTDNTFTFDDFSNLVMARYHSYAEIFSFFPSKRYNDRCIPVMFIKLLNELFGLNSQGYHFVFAAIHLINVYLIFLITKRIFKNWNTRQRFFSSMTTAIIFGAYPVSLMCVSWVSAEYDLICCVFLLLCILFYFKYRQEKQYSTCYAGLSILFYYFALRSKEMALVLPIILILYELYQAFKNKEYKITKYSVIMSAIMLVFTFLLFHGDDLKNADTSDPYYQNFNFFSMLSVLIRYMLLYFDLQNGNFNFNGLSISAILGSFLFCMIIVYSLYRIFRKKDYSLFFSLLAIPLSLVVLLPMVNMQHRLYLYIPSIFIGFSCAIFIKTITEHKKNFNLAPVYIGFAVFLYLINFSSGSRSFRNMWISYCKNDYTDFSSMMKLNKPEKDSDIYVTGNGTGYDIFYYGPGNSMKILFDDPTLDVFLIEQFPDNPKKPYLFLNYSKGDIKEIKRSEPFNDIKITQIFPSVIEKTYQDKDLDIGIEVEQISENQIIVINDISMPTMIGDSFISTTVSVEMMENNTELTIEVIDRLTQQTSNSIVVPLK